MKFIPNRSYCKIVINCSLIEDCAKDGGKEFLPRCIAFELQIFNNTIGIPLKNAVHLGKKVLAAIFSAILYSTTWVFFLGIFILHYMENESVAFISIQTKGFRE